MVLDGLAKGDRLWGVAARGIALLLFAGLAALTWAWLRPDPPKVPEYQQLRGFEAYYKAQHPECQPKRLRAIEEAVARAAQAEKCATVKADDQEKYREISQSIRATNSSEEALVLAHRQTEIALLQGALSVFLLGVTAWAAWAAADAAKAARASVSHAEADAKEQSRRFEEQLKVAAASSEATSASVKISEAALQLSRQSAQAELRPYFQVSRIEQQFGAPVLAAIAADKTIKHPDIQGGHGSFQFYLKNIGKTPAREVRLNFFGGLQERDFPHFPHPRAPAWTVPNVAPGGEHKVGINGRLSNFLERPKGKHGAWFYIAHISYLDPFNTRHNEVFYFQPTWGLDPFWRHCPGVDEEDNGRPRAYEPNQEGVFELAEGTFVPLATQHRPRDS